VPVRRVGRTDYLVLFRTPSYVLVTLGMTAMTFAIGALGWWMPDYLKSHHVTDLLGIEPRAMLGILTALAGITGTLTGGIAGDACRARYGGSYFLVSGVGLLLSVPCALLFLVVPFPAAWVFVFLAEFFLFFNTGPTNTILANVVQPAIRSSGFGLNILVIHLLGDAISPPLVGAIADRWSLPIGFVVVSLFMLLGGAFWLWGVRYLEADTAAATRGSSSEMPHVSRH
jgi:MFS family permease